MNTTLLTGYLVRGVIEINNIEMIISEMRRLVLERANIAYKKLIEWQVERIVDEICLNQIKRPEGQSILDIAANEVRRRILYAERAMQPTEFNLYIGLQILLGKIEGDPVVYLKVLSPNNIYHKQFRKIKELEPYDITSDDIKNSKGEKAKLYRDFCNAYNDSEPLACNLLNMENLAFKTKDLQFRKPEERAGDFAKEKVLNHLLACYACDQEIPPNKLMEYTLFAFNRVNYQDSADIIRIEEMNLCRILPSIDIDMITSYGYMEQTPQNAECDAESACDDVEREIEMSSEEAKEKMREEMKEEMKESMGGVMLEDEKG